MAPVEKFIQQRDLRKVDILFRFFSEINFAGGSVKASGKAKFVKKDSSTDSLENLQNLMTMINPASETAAAVIKELSTNNPIVLEELSTVEFSDLLKMFKFVMSESENVEEAIRNIFRSVQQHGALKYSQHVSKQMRAESEDDKLSSEQSDEDLLSKIVSEYMGQNKVFSYYTKEKFLRIFFRKSSTCLEMRKWVC